MLLLCEGVRIVLLPPPELSVAAWNCSNKLDWAYAGFISHIHSANSSQKALGKGRRIQRFGQRMSHRFQADRPDLLSSSFSGGKKAAVANPSCSQADWQPIEPFTNSLITFAEQTAAAAAAHFKVWLLIRINGQVKVIEMSSWQSLEATQNHIGTICEHEKCHHVWYSRSLTGYAFPLVEFTFCKDLDKVPALGLCDLDCLPRGSTHSAFLAAPDGTQHSGCPGAWPVSTLCMTAAARRGQLELTVPVHCPTLM